MKKYKNHIFDLDGTLADSMGDWAETMIGMLREAEVEYPDDIINIITPLGDLGIAKYFIRLGVKSTEKELIDRMHGIALCKYRELIPPNEGAVEYVKALKAEGKRLFVLTASPHILTDPCLARYGIFELFDGVFTCDDFDFGKSKSSPDIYRELCERAGIEASETVFYDDNVGALRAGAEAGLFTVGVYDKSSANYTEEIKDVSNRYITSFKELL